MKHEIVGNDKIFIGRRTDNEVREFAMDISELIACMDNGFSIRCCACLPNTSDDLAYPISSDYYRIEGNTLWWTPTSADTSVTGYGKFQIALYNQDGQLVNSRIYRTQIGKTLGIEGTPPEPPLGDGDYIVRRTDGESTYVALSSNSTISGLTTRCPSCPTDTDGTYVLKATVSGGAVVYSWEAE